MQLVLDFDDTLVDTSSRLRIVLNSFLSPSKQVSESEFLRLREWNRIRQIYESRSGVNWSIIEGAFEERVENIAYLSLDELLISQAELRVLSELSDRLILCSIRSNQTGLNWQLNNLGIASFFNEVIIVSRSEQQGSKSDSLKYLQERYGKLIFVGDSVDDFLSAKKVQAIFLSSSTSDWVGCLKKILSEK